MSADDLAHRLVAAYPDAAQQPGVRRVPTPAAPGGPQRCLDKSEGVYVAGKPGRQMFRPSRTDEDGDDGEWVPDLDDPATAGVLLARLKSMGAFVALTYGTNVKGQPVNHLRVWTGDGRLCSTPREFDGPTLGRACASALVALTSRGEVPDVR